MNEMNIYQRINAVMQDCDYIQKQRTQQGTGVKYDEVIAMLRDLLIKHGIVMVVRQLDMEFISGLDGSNQKVFQGRYEMDLINIDKPEEKVTHSTYAHGMDGGDKAPGKAHTYAVKLMLVKGFAIETGIDEESRAEKLDSKITIDNDQAKELTELIGNKMEIKRKVLSAYGIGTLTLLPKSKFQEAKERIRNQLDNQER